MNEKITFLHMADLHIGMRISRFEPAVARKIQEARFQALEAALDVAIGRGVDFVIIAGDIFDDNAVSITDSDRVLRILSGREIPIYVLPGNHDPLHVGAVWRRPPWSKMEDGPVRLLAEREPLRIDNDVTLYPCPVMSKRSLDDPTSWIKAAEISRDTINIAVAHGTVMDRGTLPLDDHPIPVDCAERLGMDYVALGHWHGTRSFEDSDNVVRMAYPGSHERMGFSPEASFPVGWQAYSSEPDRPEFAGAAGRSGMALVTTIERGGKGVKIEPVETGRHIWLSESFDVVDDEHFSRIFSTIARRENPERTLLHIKLKGIVSAEGMTQVRAFRDMLDRHLFHKLDMDELHVEPKDEQLDEAVGTGLMKQLLDELRGRRERALDDDERGTVERAIMALYEIARELSADEADG